MNKKAKYIDSSFLLIFFLLAILTMYRHLSAGFILSINNYLGFLLLIMFIGIWFLKKELNKYLVFILLYTFNIINFTVERFNISVGADVRELQFTPISINPIAVILLIIYLCLNGSTIKQLYTDNDKESADKLNKKVDFYYNKFSNCSEGELTVIFSNYDKYPEEARIALDKLKSNI